MYMPDFTFTVYKLDVGYAVDSIYSTHFFMAYILGGSWKEMAMFKVTCLTQTYMHF